MICTICPGSRDPFYIVAYYTKWVTTSWTFSTVRILSLKTLGNANQKYETVQDVR